MLLINLNDVVSGHFAAVVCEGGVQLLLQSILQLRLLGQVVTEVRQGRGSCVVS